MAKVTLQKWEFLNTQAKALTMIEIQWRAHPEDEWRIRCLQHTSNEEEAPKEGETITRPFLVDRDDLQPVPLEAAIVFHLHPNVGNHSAVVHLKRLSD